LRKSFSGLPGDEHILNGVEDALLLGARKLTDLIEKLPGFADRSGAAFFTVAAEKIIGRNAERFGQTGELFGAKADGLAFPVGDDALGYAQLLGKLLLREPGLLAGFGNLLAQLGAFGAGWSSL
jgi:hypothetical protein